MFIIENQTLFTGIDLANEYSHISCYDEALFEPVSICENEEEDSFQIPTVLAAKQENQQWYIGRQALEEAAVQNIPLLTNIIQKIIHQEPITYYDKIWSPEQILAKYFRKLLTLVQKKYPGKNIAMLTITIGRWTKELKDAVEEALKMLGFTKNRMQVISHQQSYMYYALSQKRELWQNDVGLFDYNEEGLSFYQLCVNRRTTPTTVGVEKKDFSDLLTYEMKKQITDVSELQYMFDNITKKALHKKVISTIYVTGKGFRGGWANKVLEGLCTGRRVFMGQNLYSAGACYGSREAAGEGNLCEYLYLSEEMVLVNISAKLYHDTEIIKYGLCHAGAMWYDVKSTIEVIPDEETELEVEIYNVIDQSSTIHFIHIDPIVGRPPKATILEISLRFFNSTACVLKVKDRGFGELYPSTSRIWEKEIHL